jgi:hypothetical protein
MDRTPEILTKTRKGLQSCRPRHKLLAVVRAVLQVFPKATASIIAGSLAVSLAGSRKKFQKRATMLLMMCFLREAIRMKLFSNTGTSKIVVGRKVKLAV